MDEEDGRHIEPLITEPAFECVVNKVDRGSTDLGHSGSIHQHQGRATLGWDLRTDELTRTTPPCSFPYQQTRTPNAFPAVLADLCDLFSRVSLDVVIVSIEVGRTP